jgi:2-phosphoglycerate kinase
MTLSHSERMDHPPIPRPLPVPNMLPARLRHVWWIGGGSGAGKSTVARQLAADYGLRLYHTDDKMAEHVGRAIPADAPLLQAFLSMDMDERWANRSPTMMLKTFPWFQSEGFELILDDLLALPEEPPILVEGFRLLPRLVAPLLSGPNQAIWLVPTPDFRRRAFDSRGFTWEIPRKTSNPEQALTNLLIRDQLFTDQVIEEATALHLCLIEVDGQQSVEEVTERVAQILGLSTR